MSGIPAPHANFDIRSLGAMLWDALAQLKPYPATLPPYFFAQCMTMT